MGLFKDLFDYDGDGKVGLDDDLMFIQMMEMMKKESGNSSSNDGCYIATCVYGSYDCPQVWTLRRFRDYRLGKTKVGRLFIKVYYAVSPKVVAIFGKSVHFRRFWRGVLDPFIDRLKAQGVSCDPYRDINWRGK